MTKAENVNRQYDLIIVGGGPGGLTAGLYGARANLKTLVLERYIPGGQLANTELVEDYPGFESILGPDLAAKMEAHARNFGMELKNSSAEEIKVDGDDRIVVTDGETYSVKAVIVATGGSPVLLGVPGEKEFAGKGVSYCAICDGAFFKNQVIAVVGGGDAAVEEGTFLTRYGSKVYIIHRRDKFRAQKIIQQRAFENPKLEVMWNTVVEEITGREKVERLQIRNVATKDATTLDVGAIFVFIGFHPNNQLFPKDVKRDENGYIVTDFRMQTTVPGIYAVGDVRQQLARQVTNAVGDGTTAAIAADKYIEELRDRKKEPAAAR
jgi:thioredoxin reductase (NADPH)